MREVSHFQKISDGIQGAEQKIPEQYRALYRLLRFSAVRGAQEKRREAYL